MNARLRASIAMVLIVCVSAVSVAPPAWAGSDARADARAQLIAHGVAPDDAAARVAALTDGEAEVLAREMDTLPAGGFVMVAIYVVVLSVALFVATVQKIAPPRHPAYHDPRAPSGHEFPISFTNSCPSGRCMAN